MSEIENTKEVKLLQLHEFIKDPTKKNKKRYGRGPASGHGKTCGRGYNGQKCRSGFSRRPGFEGGQMPLIRRVPKRGFTNIFKKEYIVVNLGTLNQFDSGSLVNLNLLIEKNIIKGKSPLIKILGSEEISKPLIIEAHKFSNSAKEKIEAAGGTVRIIK
jgi:large subunit ribosomal protein L15